MELIIIVTKHIKGKKISVKRKQKKIQRDRLLRKWENYYYFIFFHVFNLTNGKIEESAE